MSKYEQFDWPERNAFLIFLRYDYHMEIKIMLPCKNSICYLNL